MLTRNRVRETEMILDLCSIGFESAGFTQLRDRSRGIAGVEGEGSLLIQPGRAQARAADETRGEE